MEFQMSNQLKAGSIVRLKSSDRAVYISHIYRERAYCRWIERNTLQSGVFPLASLEPLLHAVKIPQTGKTSFVQ